MPNIGVYDKYAIAWGYKPILDKTAEEEKETLNGWITTHAGDPMYRFGHQQVGDVVDPSSQTEDLGDDAVLASTYGIKNLQRIVPNLIEWTTKDGETYDDLAEMYGQLLSQFNRYMGHVANNVGGVYEHYKTADQEGAVYTHVAKEKQAEALAFLDKELFQTPAWLLDKSIFERIEYSGSVERIRSLQERTLKNLLSLGKMARLIENQTLNGSDAFLVSDLTKTLRNSIWSELKKGTEIDTYRRQLQRAHIERLAYLMTAENQSKRRGSDYIKSTAVNTNQSDIRAVVRAELSTLKSMVRRGLNRTSNTMSRIHLKDILERIEAVLDPK
jgi:hypothetical protein